MPSDKPEDIGALREDFEDFFEHSVCGYVIASSNGKIERVNRQLASWAGLSTDDMRGKMFSDLLTIGGRIYYETHLGPLLHMQGHFDEVALELANADGSKLPVLVNALERRDADGKTIFIRFSIFKAADRRIYEQNLKGHKSLLETNLAQSQELTRYREQFIAILGHDLRNPLASILASASLLTNEPSEEITVRAIQLIRKSAVRMSELITNTMDFARTRSGEGIVLTVQTVQLEPVLRLVVEELVSVWPARKIKCTINLPEPVHCDAARIGQLLSNLLANAFTHGSAGAPVELDACVWQGVLTLSVCNAGEPIQPDQFDEIFQPFRRERGRISQNGLGLGLYISSEIARAHKGNLTVTSTPEKTCFTFTMPSLP